MKKFLGIFWLCLASSFITLRANSGVSFADSMYVEARKQLYSNPQRTIGLFNQAISKISDDPVWKARFYYLYAEAERLLGDFDGCIKTLYEAEGFLEGNGPEELRGKIYDLMSLCYCTLSDYTSAISLNDKATALFKSLGDSTSLASVYNSRGIIHAYMSEYVQADKFLQQALLINRSQRNLKSIAANLNNLCLYNSGNINEQLSYINEAIVINKNLNSVWSLSENYNNMGRLYYYAKLYKKALEVLKKAYSMAVSIDAKGLICDNYEYCSMVYAALGDYQKAYEMQTALFDLAKDLQSENKLRTVERTIIEERFLAQQRKAELSHQRFQVQILRRNLLIIITMAVLVFAIGFFLHQRYKRKKTMQLISTKYQLELSEHEVAKLKVHQQELELNHVQQALENSRKETMNIAVFLQSQNELLDKIRDLIKSGYKLEGVELLSHLKKVNAFIKQYQAGNKENSATLQMIDERSREFIERLVQLHPDLTPGERHLAALLRVNFSTKDVALLTGNTPKTVNMNRYRLRKALQLDSDTDLVKYLQRV